MSATPRLRPSRDAGKADPTEAAPTWLARFTRTKGHTAAAGFFFLPRSWPAPGPGGSPMNTGGWAGGIAIGAVVSFVLGWFVRARLGQARLRSAERQAHAVLDEANREADTAKRDALLQAREEALRMKQEIEREGSSARTAQLETERAYQQKEAAFNRRVELIDKKERDLKKLETDIGARESSIAGRQGELDALMQEQTSRLARIAG